MNFSATIFWAVVVLWKSCHASMFDLHWLVDISPITGVIECEVRTVIIDEGDNQHSMQRRCVSYTDSDGDTVYDLPQWLDDKYASQFDLQPAATSHLHIVGGHFSRGRRPERQRLRYSSRGNDREDSMIIDRNAIIEISPVTKNSNHRRTAESTGVSNVLVVRVTANDASLDSDAATLSDRIFGSFGSPASQFKACSMGKKQLVPASGPNIINGVLELSVNHNIVDAYVKDLENIINDALRPKVEELRSYDFIMYCIPHGSSFSEHESMGWKAYAYPEWNRSFYNGENCGYVSTVMHEISHNIGLGHAGKGYKEYGDKSGVMGFSYDAVKWPLMCFNGAMNYQLGWYSDKAVDLSDRASCGPWKGRLYGFTDYNSGISSSGVVLIKVNDIFVQFNKISDMNIHSQHKRDVVAFTKSSGAVLATTKSMAGFLSGTWQSGHDVVEICGSDTENGLQYFDIVVRHVKQESVCGEEYSLRECDGVTDSPSMIPTPSPTPLPTPFPTLRATIDTAIDSQSNSQPTSSPTAGVAPSAFPSALPTKVPSDSPSSVPSDSPSITMSPSSSPTIDTVCDDHEEQVFFFTDEFEVEHEKKCDWLRARPQIQATLCVPGHRAYDICEESCGKCRDDCHDDDQRTFQHKGVDRPCSWLALRWKLAQELCAQPDHAAIAVCPETCGTCEHLLESGTVKVIP